MLKTLDLTLGMGRMANSISACEYLQHPFWNQHFQHAIDNREQWQEPRV